MSYSSAFLQGARGRPRPPYRDPWMYFGSKADDPLGQGAPLWQRAAWLGLPYTNRGTGVLVPGEGATATTPGVKMAAVGGKGSGKSLLSALRCVHLVQAYPGSVGIVAANTYDQAFGTTGVQLARVAGEMGLKFRTRANAIIDGAKYPYVYHFEDFDSVVVLISLDEARNLEGRQFGWLVVEEVQDCAEDAIKTIDSRIRVVKGDHSRYFCGMPDDPNHWMYRYFEEGGFTLYEPTPDESDHVTGGYTKELRRIYAGDPVLLDRYLNGLRAGHSGVRVLSNFDTYRHVSPPKGSVNAALYEAMPVGKLSTYDPRRPLFVTFDFNVAPLCVSVWQEKPWTFDSGSERERTKMVLAQVGEYELWGGTTGEACAAILADYGQHRAGGLVIGDSTGSRRDTRSPGKSDWTIIRQRLGSLLHIRPGVVQAKQGVKRGPRRDEEGRVVREPKYLNPPKRDAVAALNEMLIDGDGDARLVFLPQSLLPSGGAAASCGSVKWRGESDIDAKNDSLGEDRRTVPRTHFFDGVTYIAYYLLRVRKGQEPERAARSQHAVQAVKAAHPAPTALGLAVV